MTPELSRPAGLRNLPAEGLSLTIEADAAERAALCARLELQALERLQATVGLHHHGNGEVFIVKGRVEAQLVQTCVVSLEPAPATLAFAFERLFTTGEVPDEEEITVDPALLDLEPADGDMLDLGEIVVEEIAVNLDPYPRAPGVELPATGGGQDEEHPFAALKSWPGPGDGRP